MASAGPRVPADARSRWPPAMPWTSCVAALGGSPAEVTGVGNDGLIADRDASGRRPRPVRLVRHGRARRRAGGHRSRQDDRAGEQRSARHGRRPGDGRGASARAAPILPVDSEHNAIHQCLHGAIAGEMPAVDPDRVGRPVPRPIARERWRTSPPPTRSSTRRGRWGRRSPSIPPR